MWLIGVFLLALVHASVVPHQAPPIFEAYRSFLRADAARGAQEKNPALAVAVGWNANLDVIVDASKLLSELDSFQRLAEATPSDRTTISNEEEFLGTFAHFFAQGKAAERFVTNETFFATLAAAGKRVGRQAIGGNAGLMAVGIFPKVGRVLLGGVVREQLKALLPEDLAVVSPWEVHDDQVHLIVEYSKGDTISGVVASRANRFIVSNDVANARQLASLPFLIRTQSFDPSLVILSGAHLLDGIAERSERRRLLRQTRDMLVETRSKLSQIPFHFEWASIGERTLVDDVLQFLSNVESVGFNEEEARSLYASLRLSSVPSSTFSHSPDPAMMGLVLSEILGRLPEEVTRVHFHSLGLHMIAHRGNRWKHEREAVLTGAATTSLRVCNVTQLEGNEHLFELIQEDSFTHRDGSKIQFQPAARWQEADGVTIEACPVLVCKQPVQTVGAGDSISSSALIRSMTNR